MRPEEGGGEQLCVVIEGVNTRSERDSASWVALTTQTLQRSSLTDCLGMKCLQLDYIVISDVSNHCDLIPVEPQANYVEKMLVKGFIILKEAHTLKKE